MASGQSALLGYAPHTNEKSVNVTLIAILRLRSARHRHTRACGRVAVKAPHGPLRRCSKRAPLRDLGPRVDQQHHGSASAVVQKGRLLRKPIPHSMSALAAWQLEANGRPQSGSRVLAAGTTPARSAAASGQGSRTSGAVSAVYTPSAVKIQLCDRRYTERVRVCGMSRARTSAPNPPGGASHKRP